MQNHTYCMVSFLNDMDTFFMSSFNKCFLGVLYLTGILLDVGY